MRAQFFPLSNDSFEALARALTPAVTIDHRRPTSRGEWTRALDAADALLATVRAIGVTSVHFGDPVGPILVMGAPLELEGLAKENARGRTMLEEGANLTMFALSQLDQCLTFALLAHSGVTSSARKDGYDLPPALREMLTELLKRDEVRGFSTLRAGLRTSLDGISRIHFLPAERVKGLRYVLGEPSAMSTPQDRGLAVLLYVGRFA